MNQKAICNRRVFLEEYKLITQLIDLARWRVHWETVYIVDKDIGRWTSNENHATKNKATNNSKKNKKLCEKGNVITSLIASATNQFLIWP